MFDVEAIIQTADLRALVERAGGQPDRHGRCACPLHGGDNDNGFSVFHKAGRDYWKCWTHDCGAGDAVDFVQAWKNLDFKGACEFLGGNVTSDPEAMIKSAAERFERSKQEHKEAADKMEARRFELRQESRHKYYHETMQEWARLEWVKRGLDESWQGFWTLGSCDDKKIMVKGEEYHTPTITIPLVDREYNLLNIKHRLINPPKINDKYRPERDGLGTFPPFIAFPDLGYDADTILIMEGEIKAMVTATITPDAGWQFIGVPGQDSYDKLPVDLFGGKRVIVVPDPGAELKAWKFAKRLGARFLITGEKIDDMIIANDYSAAWLASVVSQTRRAK